MIYIRANNEDVIEIISHIEIEDYTCIVDSLPEDFGYYLSLGKYKANEQGIYVVDGWIDFTEAEKEERQLYLEQGKSWERGLTTIKQRTLTNLAIERDRRLENDFTWGGHVVKLSESNQKDYLAAFTMLNVVPSLIPSTPYTFKSHSVQYYMSDLDEVLQFTLHAFGFVNATMSEYRNELIRIEFLTDEELYNELK